MGPIEVGLPGVEMPQCYAWSDKCHHNPKDDRYYPGWVSVPHDHRPKRRIYKSVNLTGNGSRFQMLDNENQVLHKVERALQEYSFASHSAYTDKKCHRGTTASPWVVKLMPN